MRDFFHRPCLFSIAKQKWTTVYNFPLDTLLRLTSVLVSDVSQSREKALTKNDMLLRICCFWGFFLMPLLLLCLHHCFFFASTELSLFMLLLTDGVVDLEFLKKKCAIIQNPVFFTSRNFEKKKCQCLLTFGDLAEPWNRLERFRYDLRCRREVWII